MDKIESFIMKKAKSNYRVLLPEAFNCDRIVKAGIKASKNGICKIVMLADKKLMTKKYPKFNFSNIEFINFDTFDKKELIQKFYELRKSKGILLDDARKLMEDYMYFSVMLLQTGYVDAIVSGAITSTANVLRPALQIIKAKPGLSLVSACFILEGLDKKIGHNGTLVLGDCSLNIEPNDDQLCDICHSTADFVKNTLEYEPIVAFLSYSTNRSGRGAVVDKVVSAVEKAKAKNVNNYLIDGDLQVDAALKREVAITKNVNGDIKGNANVLIFPDLQSGNIGYKLLQIGANCKAIGSIMLGFNKPINDLSRGSSVADIYLTIAITVLQI